MKAALIQVLAVQPEDGEAPGVQMYLFTTDGQPLATILKEETEESEPEEL